MALALAVAHVRSHRRRSRRAGRRPGRRLVPRPGPALVGADVLGARPRRRRAGRRHGRRPAGAGTSGVDRRRRAPLGPFAGAAVRQGRRPRRWSSPQASFPSLQLVPHRVDALRNAGCTVSVVVVEPTSWSTDEIADFVAADVVDGAAPGEGAVATGSRRCAATTGVRGGARVEDAASYLDRSSRPAALEPIVADGVGTVSIADTPVTLEEVIEAVQEALVTAESGVSAAGWDDLEREAFAHDVATSYVARRARAAIESGATPMDIAAENDLIRRALAAYFHAGKFQVLLDLDGVTDIMVNAHDAIWLQHVDGRTERYAAPSLRRRRRPPRRGRPPRPPRRRDRAPLRRRQADARAAPARRLPPRRGDERVDRAPGGDPPQRPARRVAGGARGAGDDRPGHALLARGGDGRRDAHRRLGRDRRRQDDARAGHDQRAVRRHPHRRHRGHPRAEPRRRPAAGQQRARVGDARGQHRGRRRDRPARAGPPRPALQPQVADRRRGP